MLTLIAVALVLCLVGALVALRGRGASDGGPSKGDGAEPGEGQKPSPAERERERERELERQLQALDARAPSVDAPEPIDLAQAIRECTPLIQRVAGPRAICVIELSPDLPAVVADPVRVTQVVVGLCVCLRDAVSAGGRLQVQARRGTGDGGADAVAAERVCLWVQATGAEGTIEHRLDAELRSRVVSAGAHLRVLASDEGGPGVEVDWPAVAR